VSSPLVHNGCGTAMLTSYAECRNSAQCAPAKHHYDHCVERVQQQESEGGAKEDCVEECMFFPPPRLARRFCSLTSTIVFHLAHCATACAAPKVWAKLK
jgi:ubiquinol-cytochrome c reductase subunit 6